MCERCDAMELEMAGTLDQLVEKYPTSVGVRETFMDAKPNASAQEIDRAVANAMENLPECSRALTIMMRAIVKRFEAEGVSLNGFTNMLTELIARHTNWQPPDMPTIKVVTLDALNNDPNALPAEVPDRVKEMIREIAGRMVDEGSGPIEQKDNPLPSHLKPKGEVAPPLMFNTSRAKH